MNLHPNNLTIISGLNSMGKSSLIQAILILRQSYEKGLLETGLHLNGTYTNIGNGKDAFSIDAADDDEKFNFNILWDNDEHLNLAFNYISNSNVQPLANIEKKGSPFKSSLFSSGFQYLSAERVVPKGTFPVSDYDINTLKTLGVKGEYTVHFLAEHGANRISCKELMHKNSKSYTLLAQTDAWMSDITPGIRITAKVIPDINQASLLYEFETIDGYTEKFRPENVGFGLTYVLPIVVSILSSQPGDLIIIENPEAHLHPAGQSTIAKLLSIAAESGVQIIIETHSDHFLNGVRVATRNKLINHNNISIFYFSRDMSNEEHIIDYKQPFIDENGKLDEWPDGFFDEWNINLDKLLG